MERCINISHPLVQEYSDKLQLPVRVVAAKIAVWQDQNNTDEFPTFDKLSQGSIKPGVSDLFESNPELASIGTQQQYSQYLDTIFPDSKVKDIVYHGSLNNIESFDKNKLGTFTKAASAKEAIFFTDSKEVAETYAVPKALDETEKGRNLLKELDISKFNLDDLEEKMFAEMAKERLFDLENDFDFDAMPYKKGLNKIIGWQTGTVYEYYSNIYFSLLNITSPTIKDFKGDFYRDETFYDIQINAKSLNNDGTILKNTYDGRMRWNVIASNVYTVFEPEQIHILSSKADIQGFKDFMAFENSEFSRYGTYQQFRDFIINKSSIEIENKLIETGKIYRVC